MNWHCLNVFLIIIFTVQFSRVESRKDWLKWFKSFKLVKVEMLSGRTLGIHKNVPTAFDIVMDGLKYGIDPSLLVDPVNHGPNQADLIYGKGLTLKGNYLNPITLTVSLPVLKKQQNVCGLVITSLNDAGNEFIFNMRLMWQADSRIPWDLIANPTNGDYEYYLRMRPNLNTRVVIFDSIPALQLMLMLTTIPGKNVNFKLAFLRNCRYKDTINIVDCSEKIDANPRFQNLPFEVPISIKCPVNCIRSWPCWGFKVYSTDSPICWAATQNFGRWGDGYYTVYKIPASAKFDSELNPVLNHGVFCRKSILEYQAFTFDRKYFDITKLDYRDTMGA